METWDAYDKNRIKQEHVLIRDKSIPRGLYHLVVEVICLNPEGQVLITQRAKTKTFPLEWEITGGSVLAGETVIEGVIRELREETGLVASETQLTYLHTIRGNNYFFDTFLCQIPFFDKDVILNPEETVDYRIIPFQEFDRKMLSNEMAGTIASRYRVYRSKLFDLMMKKPL